MEQVRPQDFVVIKHGLRNIDGNIAGVKFRNGYAVVERNSKAYKAVKSLPFIRNQPDLPLIHLRDLPFISRTLDIKVIYGSNVYNRYLQELHKELEIEKIEDKAEADTVHLEQTNLCAFRNPKNELCGHVALDISPSKYCKKHLLEDSKLEEVTGLKIPKRLTNQEKREWKEKVLNRLEKSVSK